MLRIFCTKQRLAVATSMIFVLRKLRCATARYVPRQRKIVEFLRMVVQPSSACWLGTIST
ncbi:hypothetical protein WJ59_17625 [Burkholderia gladioli]|nr:hypothetical protein WJ59_17625 [Burkholderia gladioli]